MKAVYDFFQTFKKLTRMACLCIIVLVIVQDRERPYQTVYITALECAQPLLYDPHMTNTISYDRHTTNTVQV